MHMNYIEANDRIQVPNDLINFSDIKASLTGYGRAFYYTAEIIGKDKKHLDYKTI